MMAEKEFVENVAEEIVDMISNTKKIISISQDMENLKAQQKECFRNINRLERKINELEEMLNVQSKPETGTEENVQ